MSKALALTIGEPAGIGPDLTLAIWRQRSSLGLPPFYVLGDAEFLTRRSNLLGFDVPVATTEPSKAAAVFTSALPVVSIGREITARPGQPDASSAPAAIEAIRRGVADVLRGNAAALVTNPIAKSVLYQAGFEEPGHTEYLATLVKEMTGATVQPVMLLWSPQLAVVPLTIHIALKDVFAQLTTDLVVKTARIVVRDYRSGFGVAQPRLAVAGLNPHAGEDGAMGSEDAAILLPAVRQLQAEGFNIRGPLPADTMFHPAAREQYDVALCPYHDQALIPVKTLAFDTAVNATLGLPFVRTSPDHGTAFDLAGTGGADPSSLVAALKLAARLAERTPAPAQAWHTIDSLPPLREVIQRHGLTAKKSLGQNFLLDLNLTARIARAAGELEGVTVVEVGPGPGGLTRALLAQGARVIAIERDERAIAALSEIAAHYPGKLDVVAGDALQFDSAPILQQPARVVANLPYNIATPLLIRWLTVEPWPPWYDSLVLMFQREVAERIVAPPGSKTYGRLSVLCGWRAESRILFDIAPSAFVPPPKVTSSVVQIIPRPAPLPCDRRLLERVTEAAFGQRRKMLRQSLKSLGVDAAALLEETGIDPTERAEQIPVEGFVALANAFARRA